MILAGPYETGKTLAALQKLNVLLAKYPKSQGLALRQTYRSLVASAIVTYEQKVLPVPTTDPRCPVKKYGSNRPEFYDYPNGSRLTLGGLDNPDKFLSAEYDFIYVNQAEEIALDSWEKIIGRATGRAGNVPPGRAQVMADCNPGPPDHWIIHREGLRVFHSRHEDNPTLYNQKTMELTDQGRLTMGILDSLTGVRYKRGRLGLWVGVEGQVYPQFDDELHVIDRFDISPNWRRYRVIDFGYRNPFVCQWWAEDEDGRLYLYRELYMTGRTVREHAKDINRLSKGEKYEVTIADHDASDRATLAENRIETTAAKKDVVLGIEKVEERLKRQGDGRPRLYFLRDSLVEKDDSLATLFKPTHTVAEIYSYVYPEGKDGKNKDEHPIKENDHGMDAMRYMVMHKDGSRGALEVSTTRWA